MRTAKRSSLENSQAASWRGGEDLPWMWMAKNHCQEKPERVSVLSMYVIFFFFFFLFYKHNLPGQARQLHSDRLIDLTTAYYYLAPDRSSNPLGESQFFFLLFFSVINTLDEGGH